MFINVKTVLALMLFFTFSSSFGDLDLNHGNGYTYIKTGSIRKLDTDKEYIDKFIEAYGKKLKSYKDTKDYPRLSKHDGSAFSYILRDPGKARGKRAARRKTTIAAYNQKIPMDIKKLAIAEFGATEEDFKAFPMGFKFGISERSKKKFSATFYLYREEEKRKDRLEMIDMGADTKLEMPKGVYKFTTKQRPKIKGAKYTLWGRGNVKDMVADLVNNLGKNGFEVQSKLKETAEDASIKFNKGEVDGRIALVQTTTKDPSVNLTMLVKSSKCKTTMKLGDVSLYSDALKYKCQ